MKLLLTSLLALNLCAFAADEKPAAEKHGSNGKRTAEAPVVAEKKTPAAAAADQYQVTGPVLELTDTKLVVEGRGKERHEFTRNADTKVEGELKVGAKVTVKYTMTAVSVEVKPGK